MGLPQPSMEREVFILDDDPDVRETLRTMLEIGGYTVVCFSDSTGLLETVRRRCPVCILLDVNLPGRSGLEVLKDLRNYPVPVLMISGVGDIPTAVAAVRDGALDFIPKPFNRADILARLERIIAEFTPRSSGVLDQRIVSMRFAGRQPLTPRERDVLRLVVAGHSNKDIGSELRISHRTVEEHRSNVMHKLGAKNVAELLVAVLK